MTTEAASVAALCQLLCRVLCGGEMDPCSVCNAIYACSCMWVGCGGTGGTCSKRRVSWWSGGADGETVAAEKCSLNAAADRQTDSISCLPGGSPVCRS